MSNSPVNQTSKVEVIVFDLGKVLLDFSIEQFLAYLNQKGLTLKTKEDFIEKLRVFDFETGLITHQEYFELLKSHIHPDTKDEELIHQWTHIFTPMDDMIALAKDLRTRYPFYMISNINELHWEHVCEKYGIHDLVDGVIRSCEVKAMKPDARIYQAACDQFGFKAENAVFVDDLIENAEGARKVGWHAIHHVGTESTKAELVRLGVRL